MPRFTDFDLDIQKGSLPEIEPMSTGSGRASYCFGVCYSLQLACDSTYYCQEI